MQPIRRLLLLLRNNETVQSIAIAISVTALVIGLVFLFLEWPPDEFRAISIMNYSKIDYGKVTCLSINSQRVTIEGRRYSDSSLAKSMIDILSIKPVLVDATYSECPWEISAHILPGRLVDVFDGILPAQYMVHIVICARTDDGQPDMSKCLSKSIYVFNWRVKPHDLFRVGLVGLRPDTKRRGRVQGEGRTMTDIRGIHYEISKPTLNETDGYYYQRVRQVDEQGNLVGIGDQRIRLRNPNSLDGQTQRDLDWSKLGKLGGDVG